MPSKVNALSAIVIAIGIGIGIGIASEILCLHVSSSSFALFLSFSIYSILISALILRRKLLQRPEIVYQNDKMELSSGEKVFGNIAGCEAANRFARWLPHLIGVCTHSHTLTHTHTRRDRVFAHLQLYLCTNGIIITSFSAAVSKR